LQHNNLECDKLRVEKDPISPCIPVTPTDDGTGDKLRVEKDPLSLYIPVTPTDDVTGDKLRVERDRQLDTVIEKLEEENAETMRDSEVQLEVRVQCSSLSISQPSL
jgi:hypothetical protein